MLIINSNFPAVSAISLHEIILLGSMSYNRIQCIKSDIKLNMGALKRTIPCYPAWGRCISAHSSVRRQSGLWGQQPEHRRPCLVHSSSQFSRYEQVLGCLRSDLGAVTSTEHVTICLKVPTLWLNSLFFHQI